MQGELEEEHLGGPYMPAPSVQPCLNLQTTSSSDARFAERQCGLALALD